MPSPASAHRLNVFAWLDNDRILVECNFGGKHPAANADVTVLDDTDQKELVKGKTDNQGQFSFPAPAVARQGHGLAISVNAGQGHKGEWTMSASELYAAASLTAGFDSAAIKERHELAEPDADSSTPHAVPAMPGSQLTDAQMRSLLHSALEQHLAPIRRQLAEQAAKGPGLEEIIGGIGWIMGLAGIFLYFKSRKNP